MQKTRRLSKDEMRAYLKWARSIRWSHLYAFMRFVALACCWLSLTFY